LPHVSILRPEKARREPLSRANPANPRMPPAPSPNLSPMNTTPYPKMQSQTQPENFPPELADSFLANAHTEFMPIHSTRCSSAPNSSICQNFPANSVIFYPAPPPYCPPTPLKTNGIHPKNPFRRSQIKDLRTSRNPEPLLRFVNCRNHVCRQIRHSPSRLPRPATKSLILVTIPSCFGKSHTNPHDSSRFGG
jgi:hypothetical protein